VSLYNSLQADAARTSRWSMAAATRGNLAELLIASLPAHQANRFGVNHNYFRSLPTFDPRLLGTGLLDQYLFQGFSGDVRFRAARNAIAYSPASGKAIPPRIKRVR